MVEGKPIGIGNVAYVIGINSNKLHRWYKEVLSGFKQLEDTGQLEQHNIQVTEQGELMEIKVPIFEEKNLGSQMAIDEKTIDGDVYTILSNRQTNKIALMASTIKSKYLFKIISKFDLDKRMNVTSISRDMAQHYDWLARQAFMNAYHVIDKFHVIKNIIDQLQASRIHHRQKELQKQRQAIKDKIDYKQPVLQNGDTVLQLLARSRGLLFVLPHKWSQQQRQRAKILFDKYPDIKKVYQVVVEIRRWYNHNIINKTYKKTRIRKAKELKKLINKFKNYQINEINNIRYLLKKHSENILHYFLAKETNAKAEAINQILQRFISNNYGTRNINFFLFRIKLYFS